AGSDAYNVIHAIYSMAMNQRGDIFIGTNATGGVVRTTDCGQTWEWTNIGVEDQVVRVLRTGTIDGELFAGSRTGGIFRSTDNGDTWVAINTGLTTNIVYDIA